MHSLAIEISPDLFLRTPLRFVLRSTLFFTLLHDVRPDFSFRHYFHPVTQSWPVN